MSRIARILAGSLTAPEERALRRLGARRHGRSAAGDGDAQVAPDAALLALRLAKRTAQRPERICLTPLGAEVLALLDAASP